MFPPAASIVCAALSFLKYVPGLLSPPKVIFPPPEEMELV